MSPERADAPGDAGDPVTYEVLRNRLEAITEEMRIALQRVSGSTTVTEASDFFTGLFHSDGRYATMGYQVAEGGPSVARQIQHVIENDTTSIDPGDMFIGNDPYVGALHQNDVQMAAPIFADGEIIAWAGVMAHETDVGGMDFASWSPKAEEIYQEGFRIPCVKLVDEDGVREDVLEMILNASRMPNELGIDIRAFIATLNVARDRVTQLLETYDSGTISGAIGRMLADSAQNTRELLAELPDGRFHASDFLEHDGHENRLYKIDLTMDKQGDSLRMDFSGSSEQAPGFINATRSGLHGGIASAVLPTLGYDIMWNQGMLDPVEVIAPDGLVCTAEHPAPVGAATVETVWVVGNAVGAALNKLLACSDEHRHRARAGSTGAMATFNMGGVNQYGEQFGFHLLDPIAGGIGSTVADDGIDAGGPLSVPKPRIADVERNEQRAPMRYLYRRLADNTAGIGRQRGGQAAEVAFHLHETDSAEGLVMTHGLEVPNAVGLFGGFPGSTVRQRIGRAVLDDGGAFPQEPLPQDPADIGGEWTEFGPKPGRFPMEQDDVFAASWQGGGGFGDSLRRDPEEVVSDLRQKRITEQVATETYGVVLTDENTVDAEATAARRSEMRDDRVGSREQGGEPEQETEQEVDPTRRLGDSLYACRVDGEWEVRSAAGYTLATGTTAWRDGAHSETLTPEDVPGTIRLHEELTMTAFYCPESGELLSVDVHRRDETPGDDIRLDLDSLS